MTPTPGEAHPALLTSEVWSADDVRVAAEAGADEVVLDVFLRHPAPTPRRVGALGDEVASLGKVLRLRTPTIVRPEDRKGIDRYLALGTPITSGHLGLVAE